MSFNGSGTYSLPAGQPVVTGTTISSTTHNTLASDLATALSTTICKDGQSTPTANIPMGGFRLTGLANATAVDDAIRVSQVQNNSATFLASVAGTNTITGSATPTPAAYASGQKFILVPANTNTGATTLNVSGLGAKNIFWNGAACVGGELRQNIPAVVEYDGTQFHIIANGFNAPFSDTHAIVEGSSDATKKVRIEADGITTGTTRVITMPDADVTLLTGAATQAEQETGSITTAAVTPGRQQHHKSAAKAWGLFNGSTATVAAGYNIDSITRNSAGNYTITFGTDFSSASGYTFAACLGTESDGGRFIVQRATSQATGTCGFNVSNQADSANVDSTNFGITFFGDQ